MSTAYTHMTFIPQARVEVDGLPEVGCGSYPLGTTEFGGDNRSWVLPTSTFPMSVPSFRTMVLITVSWQNPDAEKFIYGVRVNSTTLYRDGKKTDVKTADGKDVKFEAAGANSQFAHITVDHSVGNPFCMMGSIRYRESIRFYRDTGLVEVAGWRYPVPNHEMYIRVNVGMREEWRTLSRRTNEGFQCLVGDLMCRKDSYVLDNR